MNFWPDGGAVGRISSPSFRQPNAKPQICIKALEPLQLLAETSAVIVPAGFLTPHPRHPDGPGHMVGGWVFLKVTIVRREETS